MEWAALEAKIRGVQTRIRGELAVQVDIGDEIFALAAEERFPAASIIKVPIMLAALYKADQGRLDLHRQVEIPESEKVGGSGVLCRLSAGLHLPLIDLINLMIIVSDNTATNLCIDEVGLLDINSFLELAGCRGTILGRRLMDYEARRQGRDNFVTAADVAGIYRGLWEGRLVSRESRELALRILTEQQFRDKLPRLIPEIDLGKAQLAHKTGELQGVEHDAGILVVGERAASIAVLTRNLDCAAEGRAAIGEIGRAVYDYMTGQV